MTSKQEYTARDRLAAYLVLLIVFCMFVVGAIVLLISGVFTPASGSASLSDTKPLELNVPQRPEDQSKAGWLQRLIPSAVAEEAGTEIFQADTDVEQLLDQMRKEEEESDIAESERIQVDKKDLALNTNLPGNWINVILLATDSRDMKKERGRTDVMIVASINPETGEIKLSSLARDLFVPIPGIASSNRLNAAFAYGGSTLAMKTVNQNFQLNIEHYVLVNFSVMASIIDTLGGVDIAIAEPTGNGKQEYQELNEIVSVMEDFEGFAKTPTRRALTEADMGQTVRLDGLQAVAYARIRKTDDDLKRGSRQRIILQTMLEKVMKDATLPSLITIFNTVSPITETNLSIPKIMEICSKILLADSMTVSELSIPVPGSFRGVVETDSKGKNIDVLQFSVPQNVQALHEFIYGEHIEPPVK